MSSSQFFTQSNSSSSNQAAFSKNSQSSNQIISNNYFHPVTFCDNESSTTTTRYSKIADDHLSERLSKMELKKSNKSYRISTKQKKVSVSPYSRKLPITPPRTPEVSRKQIRLHKKLISTKESQTTGSHTSQKSPSSSITSIIE